MSHFTKAFALFLLAVLGLATVHCRLEQLAGLEFLACCDHEGAAPHQDDDCSRDACATVESGLFKLDEPTVSAPEPAMLSSFLLPPPEPPAAGAAGASSKTPAGSQRR